MRPHGRFDRAIVVVFVFCFFLVLNSGFLLQMCWGKIDKLTGVSKTGQLYQVFKINLGNLLHCLWMAFSESSVCSWSEASLVGLRASEVVGWMVKPGM